MNFKQWFNSNYFDPLARKYGSPDKPEYTFGDMEAAFEAGRTLEFLVEELDQIAGRATEAMHQEFLQTCEETIAKELLKEFPSITTGMVGHVINAINKQ